MTTLKTGSVLTTGTAGGDTQPGLLITCNASPPAGQNLFATTDYANAPIFAVTRTSNGQTAVYGDNLGASPTLLGVSVRFDVQESAVTRNPAPVRFPDATSDGMRLWAGTGAPGSSTVGGSASPGDIYLRRDGSGGTRIYRCTVAGTPGTWGAVA